MKTRTMIIIATVLFFGFIALNSNFVQAAFGFDNPTNTSDTGYRYGMMGGYGMMGESFDEDDYCFNLDDETHSYEWLYAHLSDEDQLTVDAKYLELVGEFDFTTMTFEEQQTAIEGIKVALVTFISDSDFTFVYNRP